MTSKEALKKINQYWADMNVIGKSDIVLSNEDWDEVYKDLDRLAILEKAIEIILKYKIRPSIFVLTIKNYREMYGKDLTLEKAYILLDFCGTQEEYELLKEVLENE